MRTISWISLLLMIIGAINWGLIGIFGFNLVTAIFGFSPALVAIVYILVGLAGLYGIAMLARLTEAPDDVCVPGHMSTNAPPLR